MSRKKGKLYDSVHWRISWALNIIEAKAFWEWRCRRGSGWTDMMDVNLKCKWDHRWRAGWGWGQGLTWRGYEVTGLFNTALCEKYSSIHHPHTQTHTWKLPTLFLLNILCSFVTQRWSSSEVYFPHVTMETRIWG